jgi:hypothetical protein
VSCLVFLIEKYKKEKEEEREVRKMEGRRK